DAFEQHITAQKQLGTTTGKETVDLKGSQPLAFQKLSSKAARIVFVLRQQLLACLMHLSGFEGTTLSHCLNECVDRIHSPATTLKIRNPKSEIHKEDDPLGVRISIIRFRASDFSLPSVC